ncbi:acylphosphatase [Pengzhenrongella sicca]|uniref:acylphosphatase n=1 Tax=Pengzhenrongella sicca TaxID=2819238 RepID=A0A8A4Z7P5_9MICO|nr:acylphosphatase [Pengzhenrongella sicca]QTE27930.1 acylphosphatase [Pengzhenrongella sicca]
MGRGATQGPGQGDRPGPRTSAAARVRGRVQGVGFRWWFRSELERRGLTGTATNLADGSVEVTLAGAADAVADLLAALHGPDAPGRVDAVDPLPPPPSER